MIEETIAVIVGRRRKRKMCCGRICMLCTCLVLVVVAIGLVFGFGVFKNGYHKIHDTVHLDCDPRLGCNGSSSRRAYGFVPPPNRF